MIKSSPILPLRFYDDIFDQQRFNVHSAKSDQVDLVFPANELPHFQLRRPKSLSAVQKIFIRKVCEDIAYHYGYYKQIPPPADVFSTFAAENFYPGLPEAGGIFDNGVDPPAGGVTPIAKYDCNKLVNEEVDPSWTLSGTPGEFVFPVTGHPADYSLKIIVDVFKNISGSFSLKVYSGSSSGTLLGTISAVGTYIYDFTSAGSNVTIVFDNYQPGDSFAISYLQAIIKPFSSLFGTDVLLDATKVKVIQMQSDTDLLVYCEETTTYFPAGIPENAQYYYVVEVSPGLYYFSEVFRIVSRREIEKYYRLKWYDECDINNQVIYNSTTLACNYYNILYLDGALFKPEPETVETGEEDENGDLNVSYRAWRKYINLEILKCPEFITDALSAIFLHRNCYLKKPLNLNQDVNNSEVLIRRIIPDVSNVLFDHFQKVNLRLLIEETHSSTGCCNEAEVFSCNPQVYEAAAGCSGDYELILSGPPDPNDGLYDCSTGELVEVGENDIIKSGGKYYKIGMVYSGGVPIGYQASAIMPSILGTGSAGGFTTVTGMVLPYSFAKLQYNFDGGGWVTYGEALADSYGFYQITFPDSLMSGATDFDIRVQSLTISCDFGYSDITDLV